MNRSKLVWHLIILTVLWNLANPIPADDEREPELTALKERLATQVREFTAKLAEDDNEAGGDKNAVREELRELLIQQDLLRKDYGPSHPRILELKKRIELTRKHFEELEKKGNSDQAAEIARNIEVLKRRELEQRNIAQESRRIAERNLRAAENNQPEREHDRRIEHMRQAAENLDAAGLQDQAQAIRSQIARMSDPRETESRSAREYEDLRNQVRQLNERVERLETIIRTLAERTEPSRTDARE